MKRKKEGRGWEEKAARWKDENHHYVPTYV